MSHIYAIMRLLLRKIVRYSSLSVILVEIELCHCELRITLRKKDFRVLDYQPKAKSIAVLSYSLSRRVLYCSAPIVVCRGTCRNIFRGGKRRIHSDVAKMVTPGVEFCCVTPHTV